MSSQTAPTPSQSIDSGVCSGEKKAFADIAVPDKFIYFLRQLHYACGMVAETCHHLLRTQQGITVNTKRNMYTIRSGSGDQRAALLLR